MPLCVLLETIFLLFNQRKQVFNFQGAKMACREVATYHIQNCVLYYAIATNVTIDVIMTCGDSTGGDKVCSDIPYFSYREPID